MRQAVFIGPGQIELEETAIPEPRGRDVCIRVEACGICGSDRSIFVGKDTAWPPVVLGHEYAGVIVACGPDVQKRAVGDRVAVDPNISCGQCTFCRRGAINLCTSLTPLGIVRPGGFAEYSLVPEQNAYVLADATSFEEAALVEPLSCCVRGMQRADVQLGDVVAVFGAGPMGLLLTQLALLRGAASVIVIEPDAQRRQLAAALGADTQLDPREPNAVRDVVSATTNGVGVDVAIEASGRTEAATDALSLLRAGGTAVWLGVCPPGDRVAVEPFRVNEREVTIRGSTLNPYTHQTALALIESKRVRVAELISDRIGLDELPAAINPAIAQYRGKVLVTPGAQA
jgi:2-desacetyl-2-hydroxyethyl bacteriochlorophyllide A dehydrogenase